MIVDCPVCSRSVEEAEINQHLDSGCAGPASIAPAANPSVTIPLRSQQTRLSFGVPSVAANPKKHPRDDEQAAHPAQKHFTSPVHKPTPQPSGSATASDASKPAAPINGSRPLAELARPETLDEFFGQDKIVGEASLLRQLIDSKRIQSMILWGPPGCGKTTLARIVAKELDTRFVEMSATIHNVQDVRKAAEDAKGYRKLTGKKAVIFLDEIHRFTKSQQDFFLPPVERGDFVLLAATTENPSFRVNAALLSRCRVYVLEKHNIQSLQSILKRAASIKLNGRAQQIANESGPTNGHSSKTDSNPSLQIPDPVINFLASMCDGDARAAIGGLEMAIDSALAAGASEVSPKLVREALQKSHLLYDREGEEHYNIISALHKSMRGSDENASLYWLGRMIYAGEDPLYVARRLVRFASEDVGLADNAALPLAMSTYQACQVIGMPECDVMLAHCVTYLARAPKNVDVYRAIKKVKETIGSTVAHPVPMHIRNAPTGLMKDLGYGDGYKYNPGFKEPVDQKYLPEELQHLNFFSD